MKYVISFLPSWPHLLVISVLSPHLPQTKNGVGIYVLPGWVYTHTHALSHSLVFLEKRIMIPVLTLSHVNSCELQFD